MNVQSIISICKNAGILFSISGEKLIVKGNEKAVAKHLPLLRDHKEAIRLHLTKPDIEELFYFFEERAGIAEFDGCQSRAEAEAVAYKDTIKEWIYNNPPPGCTVHNCVYCNHAFDFSKDGIIGVGEIYCCYHSEDSDHLSPYLKLRFKEAAAYLKSIGIEQLIQEI